ALSAMHRARLVHRDLKPANIMLDTTGAPHLMDFGLAKSDDVTALTQLGQLVGTPVYYPPEYELEQLYDERSDIYQLGLVFHEMLTARRDFPRYSTVYSMEEVRNRSPHPCPAEIADNERLAAIYRRITAPDPAKRYQNLNELLKVLESWI